ncbi:histidine phosphatase family protein [Corynebacterium uterequi]|uniref:Fructose-2,6-bisphosphatase n=1 Tax=Corynebacterium uterequi TaxID=1072256 RepID=A0A0G3HE84_9CORY|nr:histidine phosphatase family protein [Corynebacterium uterequi]AKK11621.1 fructose-2,6-bisphosphatase [Corynebacterium uterequi]
MARLILLRHGQTTYNASRRMQGHLNTELSEHGRAEALAVARRLRGANLSRIIASDLSRARDTAHAVGEATGLPVDVDARLRETNLGRWQGKLQSEVDAADPGIIAHWRAHPDWAPPGGESRLDVARRARPVIDELRLDETASPDVWPGPTVLVVAHGGTISALTCSLVGLDPMVLPKLKTLGNTRFAELSWVGDSWRLDGWNLSEGSWA